MSGTRVLLDPFALPEQLNHRRNSRRRSIHQPPPMISGNLAGVGAF